MRREVDYRNFDNRQKIACLKRAVPQSGGDCNYSTGCKICKIHSLSATFLHLLLSKNVTPELKYFKLSH